MRLCNYVTKEKAWPSAPSSWRTHTGLHVHYPQVPSSSSGGLDTRLFPLTCRLIIEITVASAGSFDDIGSFYAFAYSSTSCRRFEHKINIYKTAKCKFLATCTSLLFRYSSGHFPSVFSSSKRGIKIDGNFASAQPKRAILRPIFLSDFPSLLGVCRRRRASG